MNIAQATIAAQTAQEVEVFNLALDHLARNARQDGSESAVVGAKATARACLAFVHVNEGQQAFRDFLLAQIKACDARIERDGRVLGARP